MIRDIDGGPAQNPRSVREGITVCLKCQENDSHRSTGLVRAVDAEKRYALVEWHRGESPLSGYGRRSHHTLRELAPA